MTMRRKLLFSLLPILLLALGASSAFADVQYLSVGNTAVTTTGPYVQVTVTWIDSTHATIEYQSLTNGGYTYLMGDGGTVGANINGSFSATYTGTVAFTDITGQHFVTTATSGPSLSGSEDGFGTFNLSLTTFDGFTNSYNDVVVSLTATGGNTWSSAADVLALNNNGWDLAAHIFACADTCTSGSGAFLTGYVAAPEPFFLPSLALGMLVLAFFQVRRRTKAARNN